MIRFAENLNKMIAAGLGGAMEAPRTEVAVGHCIRYLEASGAVASFETNIAAPIRSLRVDMQPIQAGSGDPSPDNIRPISGRESVTVTRTGKNLADDEQFSIEKPSFTTDTYWLGLTKNADGTFTLTRPIGWGGYGKVFLGTFSAGTYTVSFETVDTAGVACTAALAVKKTGTWENSAAVGAADAPIGRTAFSPFTVSELSDIWISVGPFNSNGAQVISGDYQVELGSTATDYEPYDGQQVTVQLGQTVYGGTLDVSTGKLTVTHGEIASYNGEVLTGEWISDRDIYAAGTTPTIGAQVVYVLDTPQTIDLDPQQITTLIGDNNVWSDAGDVSLEYPYHEETEGY